MPLRSCQSLVGWPSIMSVRSGHACYPARFPARRSILLWPLYASCGELTRDSTLRGQGRQLLPCSAVPCEPPRWYCSCSATGCRRKAAVNR